MLHYSKFVFLLITFLTITSHRAVLMKKTLQVDQKFLDLTYCTIWCQRWFAQETKDKTPIIFVHGGPGLESGYIMNLKLLAHNQPCIFYDQSGCGKSQIKNNAFIEWTLEHYVHELAMLIDMLGFKKIILFGYSWGAAIATKYTLENEECVEKLILASPYISTSHLVENYKKLAQSKNIYEIIKTCEDTGALDSAEYQAACAIFFKNFIFSKDASIFDEFIINKEISEVMWGKNEFSVTGNLKNLNLIELLHKLQMPVLLTAGRSDTMTPDYMALLKKEIQDSTLITFEHSAHMPHIEEQSEYCKVIRSFLN